MMRSLAVVVAIGCGGDKPAAQPPVPVPAPIPPAPVAAVVPADAAAVQPDAEQLELGRDYIGDGLPDSGSGGGGSSEGLGIGRPIRRRQDAPGFKLGTPAVNGQLDKDIIRRVVRRHMLQLRFCYEKQLQVNPKLEGRVIAKWRIDAEGKPVDVSAEGFDKTVDACITARIKTFAFPKPKAGEVSVSYPFVFGPAS